MYKEDMGLKIKYLRSKVCGYSQRRLAKLVNEDIETIRMIESGELKNPQPQTILRIADVLDSFYMEFVLKESEDEFLEFLDWGTNDEDEVELLKDIALAMSELVININKISEKRRG